MTAEQQDADKRVKRRSVIPHVLQQFFISLHKLFFTVRNSSCGKVMFSQASVILSTGGRCTPLPYADISPGRHPPPPPLQTAHCSGSYWNAFLSQLSNKDFQFNGLFSINFLSSKLQKSHHCQLIICDMKVLKSANDFFVWNVTLYRLLLSQMSPDHIRCFIGI